VRERGGESARSGGAGSGWDATSLRLRDGEGNCILHRVCRSRWRRYSCRPCCSLQMQQHLEKLLESVLLSAVDNYMCFNISSICSISFAPAETTKARGPRQLLGLAD
jgi:hypothetical protein